MNDIKRAEWKLSDVLAICFLTFSASILLSLIFIAAFGENQIASRLSRYTAGALTLLLPLFWIRKKYGLNKDSLGLQRRGLSISSICLGILSGIVLCCGYSVIRAIKLSAGFSHLSARYDYLDYLLLPLSISGFASIVLSPIAEETLFRGLIYGYLRSRFGATSGLLIQASVFALSHLTTSMTDIVYRLVIGLVLGYLYERTGSLYPSILGHSMINLWAIVSVTVFTP